jgi:hypothetical protein
MILRYSEDPGAFPVLGTVNLLVNGAKYPVKALLDTRADDNFISFQHLSQHQIPMTNDQMQPLVRVRYADGTPAACYGDLEATSEISDWENETRSFEVKYYVINLHHNDYQAILGRRWLAQVDPDIVVSAGTW